MNLIFEKIKKDQNILAVSLLVSLVITELFIKLGSFTLEFVVLILMVIGLNQMSKLFVKH